MSKWKVYYYVTERKCIEVDADSKNEAFEKAKNNIEKVYDNIEFGLIEEIKEMKCNDN